MKLHKFDDVSS